MKKKYKKIITFVFTIAIIVAIVTIVAFFINKRNANAKLTSNPPSIVKIGTDDNLNESSNNFFPKKLDVNKIYSLIRIKKGKYYFQDELASLVLNQVIKKGSFVNGNLSYQYDFEQQKRQFNINFKWVSSSGETQTKAYSIKIII